MSGELFIVATPIGNLGDVTHRAIDVLQQVDRIACEDTRVTRRLLVHFGIETPTTSHHAHSSEAETNRLLARLEAGESIALVSDAGTPLLSDPGLPLVARAIALGIRVTPIPGASALLAAVVTAGLPTHRVLFVGFLPKSSDRRREVLGPVAEIDTTIVVYESPKRLAGTLASLRATLGERSAAVCRELTKKFETVVRGTLSELASTFAQPPKGEIVIVVGPPEARVASDVDITAAARGLLAGGLKPADAARTLAGRFGIPKRAAYQKIMEAKQSEEQRSLEEVVQERLEAYAESLKGHKPENMYDLIMPQLERPLIRVALSLSGGRQLKAAEMLGIHRNTLRTRLRKLGLDPE